jgi:hypothetical protein
MAINVVFQVAHIDIQDADGNLIDTIAYQAIDTISLITDSNTEVTAGTLGDAPVVTTDPQLSCALWVRDKRRATIELGSVLNQSGWTNDQAGYEQATADIYAAFNT